MEKKDISNRKVVEFIDSIKDIIKIDLNSIREEFRGMNSKLWVDSKKHTSYVEKHDDMIKEQTKTINRLSDNVSRIFSILGFLDDGQNRYNGLITKIENMENHIEFNKKDIILLNRKQFFIWGIGALFGVPVIGVFFAILKKVI